MKTAAILLLLGLLVWFGTAIVRLKNLRYADALGLCPPASADPDTLRERFHCLETVETRTNPIWHLLYGLGVL